jgi:hypothetical protein
MSFCEGTLETPKMPSEPHDIESNGPEIGDMDEGIVEGREDTGNTEYIFTCVTGSTTCSCNETWTMQTFANLRTQRDVFSSRALNLLLGRHLGCTEK